LIVVDSSVVVAILLSEPDADTFRNTLEAQSDKRISVATVLECCLVLHGKVAANASTVESWIDRFLADSQFALEPVTADQLAHARNAYVAYGKGIGHPAQLNFGDCFSYALAKALGAPLLYKGGDFAKTDIVSAL